MAMGVRYIGAQGQEARALLPIFGPNVKSLIFTIGAPHKTIRVPTQFS